MYEVVSALVTVAASFLSFVSTETRASGFSSTSDVVIIMMYTSIHKVAILILHACYRYVCYNTEGDFE